MEIMIKSALISVYNKDGLDEIIQMLHQLDVHIYSTGGTQTYIESFNIPVTPVEDITSYPSIMDGRVKTLHPKIFGGILAKRASSHFDDLIRYEIPAIDLVIVDLYPFMEAWTNMVSHDDMIEKIDIGGVSLIRAAAKNYNDVMVIPSKNAYSTLYSILKNQNGCSTLEQRKQLAIAAFGITSEYDMLISNYLGGKERTYFKVISNGEKPLRYGENPHQKGSFYGNTDEIFEQLSGKELSYNNLVDIDAALNIIHEFDNNKSVFAIIKHTNVCGIAESDTAGKSWEQALAGDSVSAFGGILISNAEIDMETAKKIDKIFYEVLIAPDFSSGVIELLSAKTNRILLKMKKRVPQIQMFRNLLNGVIVQEVDVARNERSDFDVKTRIAPDEREINDLNFAVKCVKHLKSNAIVLVKNGQLCGMGCGQTSRVDACRQAIDKAKHFGFDLHGAVMASDAFFPFPDCVELVYNEGIRAVVQPGGSIKDQLSIDYCDEHGMSMVFTGIRHFKH